MKNARGIGLVVMGCAGILASGVPEAAVEREAIRGWVMRRMAGLLLVALCLGWPMMAAGKEHGGEEHGGATMKEHGGAVVPDTKPSGLAKQDKTPAGLERQSKTPPGWSKGKKKGWKKSKKPTQ